MRDRPSVKPQTTNLPSWVKQFPVDLDLPALSDSAARYDHAKKVEQSRRASAPQRPARAILRLSRTGSSKSLVRDLGA